jgi:hypothetical protein
MRQKWNERGKTMQDLIDRLDESQEKIQNLLVRL